MEEKTNEFFASLSDAEWERFLVSNDDYYDDLNNKHILDYPSPYYFDGRQCNIPYRLGYKSSESFKYTNKIEQVVGWCLMTRHHNGYVRLDYLKRILDTEIIIAYPFVIPYIIRMLGEYVSEIWDYIFENQIELRCDEVKSFVVNNLAFIEKNIQRNISYSYLYYSNKIIPGRYISNGYTVFEELLNYTE